jgi:endonuclease/exonuclease/phosphatase family metal-dependent hydrolase
MNHTRRLEPRNGSRRESADSQRGSARIRAQVAFPAAALAWVPVVAALAISGCAARASVALPAPPGQPAFAVITWNVHAGVGNLPRLVDDLTHGRITGTPIRRYAILLQETIAGNQYDVVSFARQRQLFAYFAPVRESDRGTSGNAIVTTEQPLAARTIVLPRIRRMRKAVVATFEIEGESMFIVNAHLENRLSWLVGGLFADKARGRQTRALLDVLPPGRGVVGGDLNTILGPDEPTLRMLNERFRDTPMTPRVPTFHDRLVLDHLFFDLPEGWVATRQVIADRYNSDHHPVLGLVFSHGRSS